MTWSGLVVPSRNAVESGDRFDPLAASLRGRHEPDTGEQHRDGQRLPHRQPPRQGPELHVGLAHEFDREAAEAIDDRRQAEQESGLVARIGAPEEEGRSEEHTSELQSLMRITYAVFCLKKTK